MDICRLWNIKFLRLDNKLFFSNLNGVVDLVLKTPKS